MAGSGMIVVSRSTSVQLFVADAGGALRLASPPVPAMAHQPGRRHAWRSVGSTERSSAPTIPFTGGLLVGGVEDPLALRHKRAIAGRWYHPRSSAPAFLRKGRRTLLWTSRGESVDRQRILDAARTRVSDSGGLEHRAVGSERGRRRPTAARYWSSDCPRPTGVVLRALERVPAFNCRAVSSRVPRGVRIPHRPPQRPVCSESFPECRGEGNLLFHGRDRRCGLQRVVVRAGWSEQAVAGAVGVANRTAWWRPRGTVRAPRVQYGWPPGRQEPAQMRLVNEGSIERFFSLLHCHYGVRGADTKTVDLVMATTISTRSRPTREFFLRSPPNRPRSGFTAARPKRNRWRRHNADLGAASQLPPSRYPEMSPVHVGVRRVRDGPEAVVLPFSASLYCPTASNFSNVRPMVHQSWQVCSLVPAVGARRTAHCRGAS